jgi:hypothetical protein
MAMLMKPFRRVFLVLLVLTIGTALGQHNDDPRAALPESIKQGPGMDKIPVKAEDQENHEQVKKMFEMRQAEIRRDTEKLFQASSELRQYVNSSSSNVLSIDMGQESRNHRETGS